MGLQAGDEWQPLTMPICDTFVHPMIRTYKRKLKLTKSQEQRISSWIGACRVVYNLALEIKIESWKKLQKGVSQYDLQAQLPALREELAWMKDVDSQSLQNVLKRLDLAYKSFFKGGGFPKWANKRDFRSIHIQRIKCCEHTVNIPKIGDLKLFKDSPIVGHPRTAKIIKEPTGYFICIQCDQVPVKFVSENQAIGLDMGIAHFCIDSNGKFVPNKKHFKTHERHLRIANRSLARKKKGSNRWTRQAKKLSRLHHTIANVRKDFLHKESTRIAKQNSMVYMEDLKIKNMSKSAKGTAEEHGKNVAAKSGLNRSILDCGWGNFGTMLEYKTEVLKVNPKHTSQICSYCGHKDAKNRLSQSKFVCTSCAHTSNADVNAAKNILSRGTALYRQREALACA